MPLLSPLLLSAFAISLMPFSPLCLLFCAPSHTLPPCYFTLLFYADDMPPLAITTFSIDDAFDAAAPPATLPTPIAFQLL